MNCDFIAPHYAWIEHLSFGRALERCRLQFLGELAGCRRVLILGGGDGRFLKDLLAACPFAQVDYVDRSAGMMEQARRRAGDDRVRYYCADALADPLPGTGYDVLVTHFFLDCFGPNELRSLIDRVRSVSAENARWVVAEFRVPRGMASGLFARGLIGVMYGFFRMVSGLKTTSLTDHRPLLAQSDFQQRAQHESLAGLLTAEMWVRVP